MIQVNKQICYIVYIALRKHTVCMCINLDILIYTTVYIELGDYLLAFNNNEKKNQAAEIF